MIDQTTFAAFFSNDQAVMRKFLDLFVRETPALLRQIEADLEAERWEAVSIGTHTLKSQLKYFGLTKLVAQLQQIENQSESQFETTRVPLVWRQFTTEFSGVFRQIASL